MQVALSSEAEKLLRLAQKETKQDENGVILSALTSFIEDLQDYKAALRAEKRLGNSSFASIDELMQKANIGASEI